MGELGGRSSRAVAALVVLVVYQLGKAQGARDATRAFARGFRSASTTGGKD